MSSADPHRASAPEEPEGEETFASGAVRTGDELVDGLAAAGDVEGLLALARRARAGSDGVTRDLGRCFAAYRAAASLGSAEAGYATALFLLRGGVVPRDVDAGKARLREAADRGSVSARVHLGNFYELGVHYKADPEKADVWYRSAARAANIVEEPDSVPWQRALAELGAGRFVRALASAGALSAEDEELLLTRARAHGFRSDEALASDTPPATAEPGSDARPGAVESPASSAPARPPARRRARSAARWSAGFGAFGFAVMFVAAGAGAGYAALLGARELVAEGHALPLVGHDTRAVFPSVFALIGVLPNVLAYRFGTVVKALVTGLATGAAGFVLGGTGTLLVASARESQALACGAAGFLAALLVLGILGGTKRA